MSDDDYSDHADHAIGDLDYLVSLLDRPPRLLGRGEADVEELNHLWRLRRHSLVEFDMGGPLPVLTDVGRRLALAQL